MRLGSSRDCSRNHLGQLLRPALFKDFPRWSLLSSNDGHHGSSSELARPCPIDHFRFPDVGLQRNFGTPPLHSRNQHDCPGGFRRLQYFPQKRLVSGLRCNSLGLTENTWFPARVSRIIDSRLSQSF